MWRLRGAVGTVGQRSADLRFCLVRARENAESIGELGFEVAVLTLERAPHTQHQRDQTRAAAQPLTFCSRFLFDAIKDLRSCRCNLN